MACGDAFAMIGDAGDPFFIDSEAGLLAQFRHQYFLLFLIPHIHKATLLMLSDRMVDALNRLDIANAESVRRFKRSIRQLLEIFLRFTHRYWFDEGRISRRPRSSTRMTEKYLGTDPLYDEIRNEIEDISDYLETDTLRRQANTVVRLRVVTAFGLVGTVATGFLGMNLFALSDLATWEKIAAFIVVFVPVMALTLYTIVKSKRLSDWLEALSDERMPAGAKLQSLLDVWSKSRAAQRRSAMRKNSAGGCDCREAMRTDPPISALAIPSLEGKCSDEEWRARVDLAACYRLVEHYGMADMMANHISSRVPGERDAFLINPYGMLYEEITASSLLKVDHDGEILYKPDFGPLDYGVNRAGYVIHSAVHAARPEVPCVIHTHSCASMAVSTLACGLLPITQTAMRFMKIGYHDYMGVVLDAAEQASLVADLGHSEALILRNHGALVVGNTVGEAFNWTHRLELACRTQLAAMACNSPLREVAARSSRPHGTITSRTRAARTA